MELQRETAYNSIMRKVERYLTGTGMSKPPFFDSPHTAPLADILLIHFLSHFSFLCIRQTPGKGVLSYVRNQNGNNRKSKRKDLTVPEIPFSKIDELGAGFVDWVTGKWMTPEDARGLLRRLLEEYF